MGWLSDLINKAKKKTQEAVQGAVQQGQQAAQNAASGVQNAVQNVTSGYSDWLNGVQDNVSGAMEQGKNALGGIVDNAGQVAENIYNAATDGAQQVQQGIDYAKHVAGEAATNIYNQAVDKANEANAAVGHFVDKAQDAAGQAITDATNTVNNFVNDTTHAVGNAVQNVSQGVTDRVNDINNKIQGNTTTQAPSVTEPVTQGNQASTVTPSTTPSTTTPAPEQTPTNTQAQTPTQSTGNAPSNAPTSTTPGNQTNNEPILSYEDYLKKESEGLGYIKDQTTQHIDQQNRDTLAHIDEALASGKKYAEDVKNTTNAALEAQKNADVSYAESQRDLMKDTSQAERDAVYKYAEETLTFALGYNQEAYGKLVEAITSQMEAGKLAASEAKNLLMIMAEEAKNTTYGAAERQRTEAERQADINRQRAIADANSAYEQNKAEYGAKAEALGNMGLSGGGYGDWLNASAYAQQRSEVQGARAQSDAAKREAKYTEDMTKLQADQEYSNKKYQAESDYQTKILDIDTSYRANMSEAEQSKLAADKAAQDAEREAKRQADSKHSENVYNAESSYADWINKAESAEREGKLQSDIDYKGYLYESEREATDKKLQANQSAENAKLNAEISYVEGILGNSKELAQYKESLNAGTKEAEEKKAALYAQMLSGASNGEYGAEEIASLADAFGFSQEWKNQLISSANNYAGKVENAENKAESEIARDTYTKLLNSANAGAYNEAQIGRLADEYGLSAEQKQSLIDAAKGYADKVSKAEGNAEGEQKTSIYTGMLDSVNNGAYTAEQISYLADRYGLSAEDKQSLIDAANKYASDNAAQSDEAKATQATKSFVGLLESANAGQLTAEELSQIATEFGLNNTQKELLVKAADRYSKSVADAKTEADSAQAKADADYKNGVYTELLNAANAGGYTAEQVKELAARFGLGETEQKQLANAAQGYADKVSKAEGNAEGEQKTSIYTKMLDSVNNGAYTAEQISYLADRYGLSAEDKQSLIDAAKGYADKVSKAEGEVADAEAKNQEIQQRKTYVDLLNGVYNGAYDKDIVSDLADEFGLTDSQKQSLINAADKYASDVAAGKSEADSESKRGVYTELLDIANRGGYNEAQIKSLASEYGLTSEQTKTLVDAAKGYADKVSAEEQKYADAEAKNQEIQQRKTYVDLLSGVYSGAYDSDLVSDLADEFGLSESQKASLIKEANKYANNVAAGKTQTDTEYKRGVYTELLDIANRGGYDADQIGSLADEYGLSDSQKASLISAAEGYASRVGDEKAQADAETKLNVYTNLLDAANMGAYTSEQIENLATRYGLDATQTDELKAAADAFATNNANAAAKDEATQKNMQFINLLASANAGELTKTELENVAEAFGLDDAQKALLASAADRFSAASSQDKELQKSINFVELLNSANSGAYTKDQVAEIAGLFGFDSANENDKKLIDMLTGAADAYANGKSIAEEKANTEYKNNLFAEMLSIANQGGYTGDQLKELAKSFGFSQDKVDALTTAADNFEANRADEEQKAEDDRTTSNKLTIKSQMTGSMTDNEINSYVKDGVITEADAADLKEYRTEIANEEIDAYLQDGDYIGAASHADKLFKNKAIGIHDYQKAYFNIAVNDCSNLQSVNDIEANEAAINNLVKEYKLSKKDSEALIEYMYSTAGNAYDASIKPDEIYGAISIQVGDVNSRAFVGETPKPNEKITKILDKVSLYNSSSNCVMLDGILYGKVSGEWRVIPNNQGLYEEYARVSGMQAKKSAPEHSSSASNTSKLNIGPQIR